MARQFAAQPDSAERNTEACGLDKRCRGETGSTAEGLTRQHNMTCGLLERWRAAAGFSAGVIRPWHELGYDLCEFAFVGNTEVDTCVVDASFDGA